MDEPDDIELLRRFVEEHSESAFAALVRREIDLVYSAALRQTRNPHAAEEVTQAVFIVLARKAASLLRASTLTGWLYLAARLTAANYLRSESRRVRREQEAYMQSLMNESHNCPEEAWAQSAPLLENAMGKLSARDRDAILLRYFQNKSLREVGLALGMNEDGARMRVNRGLEKLRRSFKKHGVKLSAAAVAGAISAKSVQAAPGGLVATVSGGAGHSAALESSVALLAKSTLKLLAWRRYRMLLGLSAATSMVIAAAIVAAFLPESKAGPQPAASVAQLGPFQGAESEGFDSLGISGAQQHIRILGGTATVSNLTQGGALKIERSSALDGVLVTPHSPPFMLGQLGISEWVFTPPVTKFSSYFANNSRSNDATVYFYDVSNALIGSATATVPKNLRDWTWNGWESDVPVHRMVFTGNDAGFLHGFIWFDDVQVVASPPPCVIVCSSNITVCNDPAQCGALVWFAPPVATNCGTAAVSCAPPSGSFFPVGTNEVQCTAMEEGGATNTCSFEIVVNDCEAPVIHTIAASPDVLWPPNHRMVGVTVSVSVADNCNVAACKIISITSNDSAAGGNLAPDWEITGDLTVNLRAARSGQESDRIYTIAVECTDNSGNASRADVRVLVPHDLGQRSG